MKIDQARPGFIYRIGLAALALALYNNTKSSLLLVTLFHAALNTSAVFLPIIPQAIDDVRPTLIAMGLHCLAAIIVVIVTGPARLSRLQTAPAGGVIAPVAGV
jgi:hypothetical protein